MDDDFARFGLRGPSFSTTRRSWLLTLDFEAFTADTLPLWCEAMRRWAESSRLGAWKFSFFLSVEHVAQIRRGKPHELGAFMEAIRELHDSGVEYHPHNHCLFDPETGRRATPRQERDRPVPGYPRLPSMHYDVVHRHGRTLGEWLPTVVDTYGEFLSQAGVGRPRELAFRAGGWDYGVTRAEVTDYLEALVATGFSFESGAVAGIRGTSSWRIGAPFGSNVFALLPPLVEAAPTDFVNCGAGSLSIPQAGWLTRTLRQPQLWAPPFKAGVVVTVIHFDDLFHAGHGASRQQFAVHEPEAVAKRIDAFFKRIDIVRRVLRLEPCTFSELRQLLLQAEQPAASG
jgi:hypothetical protein